MGSVAFEIRVSLYSGPAPTMRGYEWTTDISERKSVSQDAAKPARDNLMIVSIVCCYYEHWNIERMMEYIVYSKWDGEQLERKIMLVQTVFIIIILFWQIPQSRLHTALRKMIIKKFKRSNKKRRIQTFFIITNFFGFLEETEEMFEQEELRDSSKRRKDIKMAYEIFKYFCCCSTV